MREEFHLKVITPEKQIKVFKPRILILVPKKKAIFIDRNFKRYSKV